MKLWAIRSDWTASPVCEIVRSAASTERVIEAWHKALSAVANDQEEEVNLSEPVPQADADGSIEKALGIDEIGISTSIIAVGKADLYNTGRSVPVAMFDYRVTVGGGCSTGHTSQWPAVLNPQGLPAQALRINPAVDQAGEISRLIKFRGRTYFDTGTNAPTDGMPFHDVWELTATTARRVCKFDPSEYGATSLMMPKR